jgi:hypothetical protein
LLSVIVFKQLAPGASTSTCMEQDNNRSNDIKQLQEMFPQKSEEEITDAFRDDDMEKAIDHLLKGDQGTFCIIFCIFDCVTVYWLIYCTLHSFIPKFGCKML